MVEDLIQDQLARFPELIQLLSPQLLNLDRLGKFVEGLRNAVANAADFLLNEFLELTDKLRERGNELLHLLQLLQLLEVVREILQRVFWLYAFLDFLLDSREELAQEFIDGIFLHAFELFAIFLPLLQPAEGIFEALNVFEVHLVERGEVLDELRVKVAQLTADSLVDARKHSIQRVSNEFFVINDAVEILQVLN